MKNAFRAGFFAALLSSCPSAFAAETQSGATQKQTSAASIPVAADELMITGKVEKVNTLSNEIRLKTGDGETVALHANPDTVVMGDIKPGDQVQVKYLESVALSLDTAAPGSSPTPAAASKTVQVVPSAGSLPMTTAVKMATITAMVQDVDKTARTVTLRDQDDNKLVLKAGPEAQGFDQIKIGDRIHANYTQAIAYSVNPV